MRSLMSEKEMKDLFGVDHQGMYEVRDTYIIPYLATLGPGGGQRWNIYFTYYKILKQLIRKMHRLTPDSLTCLLLRKLNDSIDDRFLKLLSTFLQYYNIIRSLAAEFSLDQTQISRILKGIIDYIYEHDQYLIRSRNLDLYGY